MKILTQTLQKLSDLIRQNRFEELETEGLEIKPVPASGGDWQERHKSINAFLNTRGGILILGIKEEGTGPNRRYIFQGWKEHAEPNLKEIPTLFTDRKGTVQNLADCFPPMQLLPFMDGKVAVVYVDELAADRRFVFLKGNAYKRILTGDHKINPADIDAQEAFKEEAIHARELQPVTGMTGDDLDLAKLNQFIYHLNQPVEVETLKPDLASALPFLQRRSFLKDGKVTVLGALVCGKHPGDRLGFRSHVHGYVDVPHQIAQDKQDFVDNVIPLMESSLGYLLRNIQVGISPEQGGTSRPEYPETLLRETVNNALAHRDYSINKQITISIKPGNHIAIKNPGTFRRHLIIEAADDAIPLRRLLPEAKPRNPKLADVLRVYRKWEGKGIGMATLVNLCLENRIDLPYYRMFTEEVCLYVCAGEILDDKMERLFQSYDRYIEERLHGNSLTDEQQRVLAYLIKSEWANENVNYTILLTPDNNHYTALGALEKADLIRKHPLSTSIYPIYVADRQLMTKSYLPELRQWFGPGFDTLDILSKQAMEVVYRFNHYSKSPHVSAKQVSFSLWYDQDGSSLNIKQFDTFYRRVRNVFNRLESGGFVFKSPGSKGYQLTGDFLSRNLI